MKLPQGLQRVIEEFEKLPGIGPKTAQRLGFYLLHVPERNLQVFGEALIQLKKKTVLCKTCHSVGEGDKCFVCDDPMRDTTTICVVEQPLDMLAIERSNTYNGLYHVLHGSISPLNNIGPDELFIKDLKDRITNGKISELILATNSTMEGEATAMYIKKLVDDLGVSSLRVSRIGLGLPVGADIEFADETTLSRALQGRGEF